MTALNKQDGAGDVIPKTYYIHPAAFGGTKDPGHGHVPVVKADDFKKLRAKIEAAEKRIAELEAKLANPVLLPKTNGYWNEQEKAFEDAITLAKQKVRLAGFRCEGDE